MKAKSEEVYKDMRSEHRHRAMIPPLMPKKAWASHGGIIGEAAHTLHIGVAHG